MEHTGLHRTQKQVQRSMEASKQKIYAIHGNVINILEELEDRQQRKHGRRPLSKSQTDFYDHREKDDETVDEVVQAQLITFEAVFKSCDPEVKESICSDLGKKTMGWINLRRQDGTPIDVIDRYAGMVLEIITTGTTAHSKEFLDSKSSDYKNFKKEDAELILHAKHGADQIDREFENNPALKAHGPTIRRGESQFIFISGYKGILLALANDGTVVTYEDDKQWKIITTLDKVHVTQIYEMHDNHKVIVLTEHGQIFYSNRKMENWQPVTLPVTDTSAVKLAISSRLTLAIDNRSKIWKIERSENQLKGVQFTEFIVSEGLKDLAFGRKKVWVIDNDGQISYMDSSERYGQISYMDSSERWEKCPTKLASKTFRNVYANDSNDQVWVIDDNGVIYSRDVESEWTKIESNSEEFD